tara:strand:- start:1602 stop:2396 length:795 start_codon:yes stop_codon:yes gene_type:complete
MVVMLAEVMKKDLLTNLFQSDGKTVILPLDHGTAIPVQGLEKMGELILSVKPNVDGFVLNLGAAVRYKQELEGTGLCLRTDVYKPDTVEGAFKVYGIEEAEEVGAHAVMQMLYPGHSHETEIARECAETIAECLPAGMPTIIETLPVGLGLPEEYTAAKVGFAVRQAAELGATVVKTAYPTGASVDEFRAIVEGCFVPLIVLGGAAMGDDSALLGMVRNAMDAGASGIAVGRNVWQHPNPELITKRLQAVVHDDSPVEQALKIQ